MESKSLRIVYMGTPDFAVAPLEKLLDNGYDVVAVITAPDKAAGRGKKIRYSAIKQYILDRYPDIPLLQPENLKDPAFVEALQKCKPDLQVVVAFRMLPEVVWRIPRLGTFNLHASLLPQYRGAAPINHVIIQGEKETGLTTFLIDDQIDTGNILLQQKTAIAEDETAGELHDRLMLMGSSLVSETVAQLASGHLKPKTQELYIKNGEVLKKAPKIFKEDCRVDWKQSGSVVNNLIRGLSPYPTAITFIEQSDKKKVLCKIFRASFEEQDVSELPGSFQTDGKTFLKVAVGNGYIQIHSIQQEGKRRMSIRDFLAGFNFSPGPYRFF